MKVIAVLTSPEHHPTSKMPNVLRKLLYSNDDLLNMIECTGCPNTGCEHSLTISGERSDVVAWLDLLRETYPMITDEVNAIKREIHLGFVRDPSGTLTVRLKRILKFVTINDKTVQRNWFWVPEEGMENAKEEI